MATSQRSWSCQHVVARERRPVGPRGLEEARPAWWAMGLRAMPLPQAGHHHCLSQETVSSWCHEAKEVGDSQGLCVKCPSVSCGEKEKTLAT